jgi:hypothetical protein
MNKSSTHSNSEKTLRVRRGRVDSVDLYEVKEHELEILEKGEPVELCLNFSIFLISTAISTITTLCTATFASDLVRNMFLFVSIIGVVGGIFLFIFWWRTRTSIKSIIKRIKDRIPPELVVETNESHTEIIISSEEVGTSPKG